MNFILRLLYYCFFAATSCMALFYIYTGIFKRNTGENPYYLKEWFAFASFFVLGFIYKAYYVGEVEQKYGTGLLYVLSSWLVWGLVVAGFLILAKSQGRL